MKQGQLAEFFGIIILIVALVMVGLFSYVQKSTGVIERIESSFKDIRTMEISMTANLFGRLSATTIDNKDMTGITMIDLIGVYSCYNNETANYTSYVFNISDNIRKNMDYYYGENNWVLEIENINQQRQEYFTSHSLNDSLPTLGEYFSSYDFIYPLPCMNVAVDTNWVGRGVMYTWA